MNTNITLFIDTFGTGGAERVCINYANNLSKLGKSVSIIVFNKKGYSYVDELDAKVKIISLDAKNGFHAFFRLLINPTILNRFDIFIAFNHQISLLLYVLTKIKRLNKTIIARNVNNLKLDLKAKKGNFFKRYLTTFLMRFLYCRMDGYIAQCNAMKRSMVELYSIEPHKIEVIHNPVAPKFKVIDIEKDVDILFVGRLTQQKGIDKLVEVLTRVYALCPTVRVHIVGQGNLEHYLVTSLDALRVQYVHEHQSNNIVELYNRAKVTILTSYYEGYPNVLVESIACGVPVIAYNCESGPDEIIKHGLNGFLIPCFNVEEFANNILYVLNENFQINAELVNSGNSNDKLIDLIQRVFDIKNPVVNNN
ncbi:glycosyltransferase [Aeromonas caviae]|uniref:glycosyltransferase n=1 Tax=Aeromonas caviae TaxID=648 RepID=UPI00244A49BB|nr:glycosyltransferase [Aeromonas caviae]MDH1994807.1 glycosyltransferase [Aeromonas caviae]